MLHLPRHQTIGFHHFNSPSQFFKIADAGKHIFPAFFFKIGECDQFHAFRNLAKNFFRYRDSKYFWQTLMNGITNFEHRQQIGKYFGIFIIRHRKNKLRQKRSSVFDQEKNQS